MNKIYAMFVSFLLVSPFYSLSAWADNINEVSPLKFRSIETRVFQNLDQRTALKVALSTFQDLGFFTNESSSALGLIKADQIQPDKNLILEATLTITPSTANRSGIIARLTLSRSFINYGEEGTNFAGLLPPYSKMISDPLIYQQFFNAFSYASQLEKGLP